MPQRKRDDFSAKVQRTLAERAAYICSNPDCRDWTVEPHSDPEKSLKTGEAAHIRAAAEGGPRYDPSQTPEERASIQNAIWLCTKCSTVIDKDEARYPVELLFGWKQTHEEWLRNGGVVPSLPDLSFITLTGFTLPEVPGTMSLKDCKDLREHRFRIRNGCDTTILMIDAIVQLPEPAVGIWGREKPPGMPPEFNPVRPEMVVSGNMTVTRNRPPLAPLTFQLRAEKLPPRQAIEIAIYTSIKAHTDHDITHDTGPFAELMNGDYLLQYVDGSFQFDYRGATLTKKFFAPIKYDKETRVASVIEVREDKGDWKAVKMTFFS